MIEKNTCAACQSSVIEYVTPIIDDEYESYPPICGIDYHYRCNLHNINVDRNYFCSDFELPF